MMIDDRPVHRFYLHGFASSPQSSKAVFLAKRFGAFGIPLQIPDFNQPDFFSMTVSRMLGQLQVRLGELPAGDVELIGSSLGGFVAVEAAVRALGGTAHPIVRLVLLAPALELDWERWPEVGPGGIERWHRDGSIEVFHYADDRPRGLGVSFYDDAIGYRPSERRLTQPMVIFQGLRDESVDPAGVRRFAEAQPSATLHLLDDEHQLKKSLEFIWSRIRPEGDQAASRESSS